jgi:hypothetical protein
MWPKSTHLHKHLFCAAGIAQAHVDVTDAISDGPAGRPPIRPKTGI